MRDYFNRSPLLSSFLLLFLFFIVCNNKGSVSVIISLPLSFTLLSVKASPLFLFQSAYTLSSSDFFHIQITSASTVCKAGDTVSPHWHLLNKSYVKYFLLKIMQCLETACLQISHPSHSPVTTPLIQTERKMQIQVSDYHQYHQMYKVFIRRVFGSLVQ